MTKKIRSHDTYSESVKAHESKRKLLRDPSRLNRRNATSGDRGPTAKPLRVNNETIGHHMKTGNFMQGTKMMRKLVP